MNSHFKVRPKGEPSAASRLFKGSRVGVEGDNSRRIHTEAYEHFKDTQQAVRKINLYPTKPLGENKQVVNTTSKNITVSSKATYSQISLKASSKIKSILVNDSRKSKDKPRTLLTEPSERFKPKADRTEVKRMDILFNKKSLQTKEKSIIMKEVAGKDKYSFEEQIGSGTFGVVYKGRNKATLEVVAIKKVFQDKKYKNREGEILKLLNHCNVLHMKDSFFTQEKNGEYLNVVMDYFQDTVYSYIRRHNKRNPVDPTLIKLYSYQLFRSLLYLDKISICHRDIKPHNILVDRETNRLVLCDFGSAKRLVKGEPNIAYICSRCYRAPELIFGATDYTTQIDMWSSGCVIAQMLVFEPLFVASNNIDQLVEIIKSLGTPTEKQVMSMNPEYDMEQFQFPHIPARDWRKIIKQPADPLLIDLLKGVLMYDPSERLTPFQALNHPYYDDLRNEKSFLRLKKDYEVPQLFNFTKEECTAAEIAALKPEWTRS